MLTLWQLEGLVRQALVIWRKKSARSLNGIFFSYFFVSLVNLVIYALIGEDRINTTLLINGGLQLAVVAAILPGWFFYELKTKSSSMRRGFPWAFTTAFIAVVALITLLPQTHKPLWMIALAVAGMPTLVLQIVELWKQGRGTVELRMLLPQCATNVYLSVFAFATGERAFQWIGPVYAVLFAVNIAVWCHRSVPPISVQREP
jgi:uncharacterized protein with PQ loop repeat